MFGQSSKGKVWAAGAAVGLFWLGFAALAPAQEEPPAAGVAGVEWESFRVEHRGFRKELRFEALATGEAWTMDFKGIPWRRMSAVNIVVDPEKYDKGIHKVRYRFAHPLTGQALTLRAKAVSHRVRAVPIRSEHTAPVAQVFAGESEEPFGTLTYDWYEPILFRGELDGRPVEIERLSAPSKFERGPLKYFLFPFPLEGDFVARIDGREVARFTQHPQHGARVAFDLAVVSGDPALREHGALLFVMFDLLRTFVQGAAS